MTKIGVLALQGDFAEHISVFQSLGADVLEVRLPADLDRIDGLVIPGGESTSMAILIDSYGLRESIRNRVGEGMAVWGTCAGLILLATVLDDDRPEPLMLMGIEAARNSFGRQIDSFEVEIPVAVLGNQAFPAVFIRAPIITNMSPCVQGLATLPDGSIVAARQDKILATAFHPELTSDLRFHEYFLWLTNS